MKSFCDKVVVVTGAGGGMGRAYAEAFAREGAKLSLNDWDGAALEETRERALKLGAPAVHAVAFDVSNKDEMYAFAASTKEALGNAHVIVNNAGVEGDARPIWEISDELFERVININLWGVIHGTRAFLPQLFDNGEGAVVNVSSVFGLVGPPLNGDYCTAKFAVRGFTECLMAELHESPISVHVVHPGGIATNICKTERSRDFGAKFLLTPPEDIVRVVIDGIRRGRRKIVYGNDSLRAWFGSNFLPLRILNIIMNFELRRVVGKIELPKPKG
ncbi:MAG: SDR family oxidoreductase [Deltaproteobacteria bacterium]|nr:SDR family oxidoreductase [Deltaproteobacteria bacterium]